MNFKFPALALLICASLSSTACSVEQGADDKSGWAGMTERAQADIREEMASHDLDIGKGHDGVPRAALSPQGDLLIAGDKVDLTPAQRSLLLAYRTHLAEIAEAGAVVGMQGAAIAATAMKEAAKAALSGDKAGMEARMKKEAAAIEVAAQALCDRMPALLESQRAAAQAVPEFRPYATMDETDVRNCNAHREKHES